MVEDEQKVVKTLVFAVRTYLQTNHNLVISPQLPCLCTIVCKLVGKMESYI